MIRVGEPGRHSSFAGEICDFRSVRSRVLVGNERHRGDLAAAVATLAMLLKDGENIAVERWRREVASRLRSFCFLRLPDGRAQQRNERGKDGYLQLHSWISYTFSRVGCKREDTALRFIL